MIGDGDTNWSGADTRLKLPARFQALNITGNELQLVSLYESLRVRSADASDELLNMVFARLQRGCTGETLLEGVDVAHHTTILAIIRDLSARGLLAEEAASANTDAASSDQHEAFQDQTRFFSNFRPRLDAVPANGTTLPADASAEMQQALNHATVMVVGLGRIGSRLVKGLAYAGLGHIYCSDPGIVAPHDLIDSSYERSNLGQRREEAVVSILQQTDLHVECIPLGAGSDAVQGIAMPTDNPDVLILCEDRFDPNQYSTINRLCLERAITWIGCRNLGSRIEVGPLIVPLETACFKCFELRKAANSAFYESFLATQGLLAASGMSLGSLNITIGYEILALEVIKILTGFSRPLTYGSVYSFDLVTFEGKLHPALKIPRCPECNGALRDRPTFSIWDTNAFSESL